jgi:hypothetical protein
VTCSTTYIRSNFGFLLESKKRLETQGLPLQESTDITKNASEKLSAVKGEVGESVSTKLQAVLKRNLGFSTFTNVCQVLNGDPPEKIPLLKYASVTSCDVGRPSSDHRHRLLDKRQSMTRVNMEKIQFVLCIKINDCAKTL